MACETPYKNTIETSNFFIFDTLGEDPVSTCSSTLHGTARLQVHPAALIYSYIPVIANTVLRVGASLYYLPISGLC